MRDETPQPLLALESALLTFLLPLLLSTGMVAGQRPPAVSPAGDPPVQWDLSWPDPSKPVQGYPVIKGVEHHLIYSSKSGMGAFSHHAQIAYQGGVFYASWSSHRRDEDASGQRVLCSISRNGRDWKDPFECIPPFGADRDAKQGGRVVTANGLVSAGGAVYVIGEVDDKMGTLWPRDPSELRKQPYLGRIGWGKVAREIRSGGELGDLFWLVDDPPEPVDGKPAYPSMKDPRYSRLAKQINEYLAAPLHLPAWDFLNRTAWTVGADGHQLCEPSVYQRPDGVLVKLSRDRQRGERSFRLYASVSRDGGRSWTEAVRTNIPDSPSKSTTGMLPDGRIYLIGNQVEKGPDGRRRRDPLVLSLSRDGKIFNWAAAIRYGAPKLRHQGSAKGPGFQYPSAIVARGALWAIYSIGKEDVAVSRVPLSALPPSDR